MSRPVNKPDALKIVLITGMSGSGKSIAIRALEDSQFYCIDNLPTAFIPKVLNHLDLDGIRHVAIAVDSRSGRDIIDLPSVIDDLRGNDVDVRIMFLNANDETLTTRYSETRRRHPFSSRLGEKATVLECVRAERDALANFRALADVIDTSGLLPNSLRRWVLDAVEEQASKLTLIFETFGYKKGLPSDADLVFDVRCLNNPHYDSVLRAKTGKDAAVQTFIRADPRSDELLQDIEQYLRKWLPSYLNEQRSYVTIAIGCTGGQHRSVYMAEMLAERFTLFPLAETETVLVRHRNVN